MKGLVGIFVAVLACSLMGAELLTSSFNTLQNRPQWLVGKRNVDMGVTGGDQAISSRSMLARDRLNLDAWYGFHKVQLREAFSPQEVSVDYGLAGDAHLALGFERRDGTRVAILLSGNDEPSRVVELNDRGQVLKTQELTGWDVVPTSGSVEFLFAEEGAFVRLGNLPERHVNIGDLKDLRFFVQGGLQPSRVKQVRIVDVSGREFVDNFSNRERFIPVAGVFFIWGILIVGSIGILFSRLLPSGVEILSVVMWNGLGVLFALLVFDRFVYSSWSIDSKGQLLFEQSSTWRLVQDVEVFRYDVMNRLADLVEPFVGPLRAESDGVDPDYPVERIWRGPLFCQKGECRSFSNAQEWNKHATTLDSKGCRILWIGTSQAVGSGARHLTETFWAQWATQAKKMNGNLKDFDLLNISISGAQSRDLVKEWSGEFSDWHPNFVVVQLSVNESNVRDFEASLNEFAKRAQQEGAVAVFILEASSVESSDTELRVMHRAMTEVAHRNQIALVNLHEELRRQNKALSGFLWWDIYHFTQPGQDVVARYLASELTPLVAKVPACRRSN